MLTLFKIKLINQNIIKFVIENLEEHTGVFCSRIAEN